MLNGNEILKACEYRKNELIFAVTNYGEQMFRLASPNRGDDEWRYGRRLLLKHLIESTPVFWDISIWRTARNGHEIFKGQKISAANPEIQLWLYAMNAHEMCVAADCSEQYGFDFLYVFAELVIFGSKETMSISFMSPGDRQIDAWNAKKLPEFVLMSCRHDNAAAISVARFSEIEACIRFMSQPFIETTSLDRVATFSGAHHNAKKNDSKKIKIVYLRRREQHGGNPMIDSTGTKIDWSCQWLVAGHWRNQYHPSDQSHKPMFIQSYVKGPEDKPFRAPRERLFAAVR